MMGPLPSFGKAIGSESGLRWLGLHGGPASSAHPAKNKQVSLYQTEKLLHSKGNHKQDEKTTLRMGENICK